MERLLGIVIWIPVLWACSLIAMGVPGAFVLRLACRLLGEREPTLWGAMKLTTSVFWVQVLIAVLVGLLSLLIQLPFIMSLSLLSLPTIIKLYAHTLELSYPRAAVIGISQMLVMMLCVAFSAWQLGVSIDLDSWPFRPFSPVGM